MDSFLEELKEDYASWLCQTLQFYTDKELKKLTKDPYQLVEFRSQIDAFISDNHYDDYTWYDVETHKEELLKLTKNILNDKLKERGISL